MVQFEKFSDYISLERKGRSILVRFERSDRLNSISAKAMRELRDVARFLREDTESTAIILYGKDTGFSAGADLKDEEQANWGKGSLLEWRNNLRHGPDMCDAWEALEQVTICAIEKFCVGGAMALSLACDIRIIATDAHFRLPEIPLGMNMGWHANPRLVNLVGPARAKQITILGEAISAEEAMAWGLAQEITKSGEALTTAQTLADKYASLPPIPVRMTKQAIDMAAKALNPAATYMDRDQFMVAAASNDMQEAIKAFLEKKSVDFTGN